MTADYQLVRRRDWRKVALVIGLLAFGALWTGVEVLSEEGEATSVVEFLLDTIEKSLLLVGAGGVFLLLKSSHVQHWERQRLIDELEVARREGESWRRSAQTYMNGVGEEIEKQFQEWGLSEAEAEVARFMIKGLSHKEIADLRGTAEATVRQQARNVYQKSNLPGKAAFSAYFLEDLLPPANQTLN